MLPSNTEPSDKEQNTGCLVMLLYIILVPIISTFFFIGLIMAFLPKIGSVLSIWLILYFPIAVLVSISSFILGRGFIYKTKNITGQLVIILSSGLLVCLLSAGISYIILNSL